MTAAFFPAPHNREWGATIAPEAGFNASRLIEAVALAVRSESAWPRSMYLEDGRYVGTAYIGDQGEDARVIGPVVARGGVNGLLLKGGRMIAEWGDTRHADMTFSVAKSYLAILTGLAVADGLIADIDEPVARSVAQPWFDGGHNGQITWRHLLQQTSEWEGSLWGKSDVIDRNRQVGAGTVTDASEKGKLRPLQAPGTHFEYNDVRVNLLAAALLYRFRRPLPEVLKERIMDPIGASGDWSWHGYETSWVEIDGQRMQSVSGGGHWGGGIFVSARDHARLGLLVANGGAWNGQQLIPADWVGAMLAPSPCNDGYGFMWWLNTGRMQFPSAPASSVFALGAGSNIIWIDPDHDLVGVFRWIDKTKTDSVLAAVLAAIEV